MLTLSELCKDFGPKRIVEQIDLIVAPGEFVVVIGPSGCGKTTLLRLAAGALSPTSGRVENRYLRTASVFQEPRLLPWSTAAENAAFGLKALGRNRSQRRDEAEAILTRLGLGADDLGKRPAALSGGMAQRVAFARALAVSPDLLLMDEPFGALDVGMRRSMQDLTRQEVEKAGTAVLFVTHDIAEALRLASRIIVLSPQPGRIVADIAHSPLHDPAAIFQAAADLLKRPEIDGALFG